MATTPNKMYLIVRDLSELEATGVEDKMTLTANSIYKVLSLNFNVERPRNQAHNAFRTISYGRFSVILDATQHESNNVLYAALKEKTSITHTIIFGTRNEDDSFLKYDNSSVFDGYITSIEELFENDAALDEGQQKIYLEYLVTNVNFLNDKNI